MELYQDKQCSGCGLCSVVCPRGAITLGRDAEHFAYPSIDREKCIDCGLCVKICPFNSQKSNGNAPLLSLAVKAKNDIVRQKSSSGGVFPLLAEYIIQDFQGVVFGATYLTDQHMKVAHARIESVLDIQKLQGSKYVQSDICGVYETLAEDLQKGRYVLFCGTPCQVSACQAYLKFRRINTDNLLTCDFVCHGVPSPGLWEEYVEMLERAGKARVIDYDFRHKDDICRWGQINVRAEYEDHCEVNTQLVRAFINTYFANLITRPSCAHCSYACMQRCADVTLADCWGVENIFPTFADRLGVSLVLANSAKGETVINHISDRIVSQPINAAELTQPHLRRPCEFSPVRAKFWRTYEKYGLLQAMKKYTELGFQNRLRLNILKLMAKLYHVIKPLVRGGKGD